jgi:uncharacterized damage-inducible protein DinB
MGRATHSGDTAVKKEEMLDLVRYDDWACARLVSAIAPLTDEAFGAEVASSFGSVRSTFAHIVWAGWIWLSRWQGRSPAAAPPWVADATRAELVVKLEEMRVERAGFLAGLPEPAFDELIEYRNLAGRIYRHRLADLVRHVVNHSTYHRGQAVTQLRQLGVAPPSTDFILYRLETS